MHTGMRWGSYLSPLIFSFHLKTINIESLNPLDHQRVIKTAFGL